MGVNSSVGNTGVAGLVKVLGENLILKGLTFNVALGEFVAILGPSGCGKTTLLRCIAGLEDPTDGKIWITGSLVFGDRVRVPPRKREIGMVFQSYACWPHMTVYENVAFPLKLRKIDERTVRTKVEEILLLVGLTDLAERYPFQLSGGQQQRVSLARSLSYDPKILLLDEPLSNLDANLRVELRREIRRIQRETKITTLYVTHDKEEAFALADRLFLMEEGVIIEEGSPDEIRIAPKTAYAAAFLDEGPVLYGTVVKTVAGQAVVKVGDFCIETNNPSTYSIGTNVGIFLPSKSLRIEAMKAPGGSKDLPDRNFLVGEIVEIERVKDKIEVRIEIAAQTIVHRMSDETTLSLSPGTRVNLSLDPNYARVVEVR